MRGATTPPLPASMPPGGGGLSNGAAAPRPAATAVAGPTLPPKALLAGPVGPAVLRGDEPPALEGWPWYTSGGGGGGISSRGGGLAFIFSAGPRIKGLSGSLSRGGGGGIGAGPGGSGGGGGGGGCALVP